MSRAAIIAALAGELRPLVRGWPRQSRNGVDLWRLRRGGEEWIAACAGTGMKAAGLAFAEIEKEGPIDFALSVGWAGALSEEFVAGRVYRVRGVVDASTGERFPTAGSSPDCWLVTSPRVADRSEKRRLAAAFGAGLVDMEAAAVARLAALRAIPFDCIKGVSDGTSEQLPDFNRFISASGQFQLGRFIGFALVRPWHWPALGRMNANSRKASRGLGAALIETLAHPLP
jgi:adenosylhomocysteine nucleosidase